MSRRGDVAFATGACVVLAGYNNVVGLLPWHRRWYPVVNGCAAVAAVGIAAASGLSAGDLGLGRDRLRDGGRLGSLAAAPVVAAFGLAAVIPGGRRLLDDQRIAGLDGGSLLTRCWCASRLNSLHDPTLTVKTMGNCPVE